MKWITLMGAACIAAGALALPPLGDGRQLRILPAGYTDADVTVQPGEEWWVLFSTPGASPWLRYTPLNVSPKDAEGDRHIEAPGFADDEVILLFQGTKELLRGPVTTYFNGSLALPPGLKMRFGPSEKAAELVVDSDPVKDEAEITRYTLRWREQTLVLPTTIRNYPGDYARLLWVGDLDQDNRPDLLLDTALVHSERKLCLYLSGCAEQGEQVHLVATFVDHGC